MKRQFFWKVFFGQFVPRLDREAIGEDSVLAQAPDERQGLVVEEAVSQSCLARHGLRVGVEIDHQPEVDIPLFAPSLKGFELGRVVDASRRIGTVGRGSVVVQRTIDFDEFEATSFLTRSAVDSLQGVVIVNTTPLGPGPQHARVLGSVMPVWEIGDQPDTCAGKSLPAFGEEDRDFFRGLLQR